MFISDDKKNIRAYDDGLELVHFSLESLLTNIGLVAVFLNRRGESVWQMSFYSRLSVYETCSKYKGLIHIAVFRKSIFSPSSINIANIYLANDSWKYKNRSPYNLDGV